MNHSKLLRKYWKKVKQDTFVRVIAACLIVCGMFIIAGLFDLWAYFK